MTTYNINNLEGFRNDYEGMADYDCALQMFNTAQHIINDLEKFYNRENDEDNLWDYFDDVLDIEYTITSRMEYRGVEICLCCGGPYIALDTTDNLIKCRWWGTNFNVYIDSKLTAIVDCVYEEYYNCLR